MSLLRVELFGTQLAQLNERLPLSGSSTPLWVSLQRNAPAVGYLAMNCFDLVRGTIPKHDVLGRHKPRRRASSSMNHRGLPYLPVWDLFDLVRAAALPSVAEKHQVQN